MKENDIILSKSENNNPPIKHRRLKRSSSMKNDKLEEIEKKKKNKGKIHILNKNSNSSSVVKRIASKEPKEDINNELKNSRNKDDIKY